jgi:hypothetical protein
MLHLISIEILKLQRNRSFIILAGLFVISIFGVNYIATEIIGSAKFGGSSIVELSFPAIWKTVSYITSFLTVIPCIIIIMHTCSEYTYRTHRQNIIDGLSRNQYVTTKILFVVALALFSAILTFITAFVIGITSGATVDFTDFRYIYYFFVQALMYGGMALLFALLLKKAALTIGIFFAYSFIIENILERYINKIPIGIEKLGQFLPLSSSDQLLFPDGLRDALRMAGLSEIHRPEYVYLVTSAVYIILCGVACYFRYRKQDL